MWPQNSEFWLVSYYETIIYLALHNAISDLWPLNILTCDLKIVSFDWSTGYYETISYLALHKTTLHFCIFGYLIPCLVGGTWQHIIYHMFSCLAGLHIRMLYCWRHDTSANRLRTSRDVTLWQSRKWRHVQRIVLQHITPIHQDDASDTNKINTFLGKRCFIVKKHGYER
jgi:hypothetical protein